MSQLIVDSELNTNSAGAIKTYLSDDITGKQQLIQLWFATTINSVPFLDYGNSINEWIFQSMQDSEIEKKITALVKVIKQKFNIDINSEDHIIDKDNKKIYVYLTLQNNYVIPLKI
jgi:hypothetical protein